MIPPPHIPPTPQLRRRYICYRAPGSARIDGRLDKPFWADAPWTEEFIDIEGVGPPANRSVPRHRTRAKMLWDDRYFYIGAEMEEPHIWATLTERDSIVYHDNDFEVFLNPTGDSHNYYELEINALNTIFDLFLPKPYRDGGPADHGWDLKGLISAVHIEGTLNDPRDTDRAWSVELAMPWSAFDRHPARPASPQSGIGRGVCPPRDGDQWRINFSRVHWDLDIIDGAYRKTPGRREHNWVWSPQGVIDMHRPEQWGSVQFSSIVAARASAGAAKVSAGSGAAAEWRPDHSEPVRDALHRIYYAQLAHKAVNGKWAGTFAELGTDAALGLGHTSPRDQSLESDGVPIPGTLHLKPTAEGWIASVAIRRADAAAERWAITHDSRVFRVDDQA